MKTLVAGSRYCCSVAHAVLHVKKCLLFYCIVCRYCRWYLFVSSRLWSLVPLGAYALMKSGTSPYAKLAIYQQPRANLSCWKDADRLASCSSTTCTSTLHLFKSKPVLRIAKYIYWETLDPKEARVVCRSHGDNYICKVIWHKCATKTVKNSNKHLLVLFGRVTLVTSRDCHINTISVS